MNELRGGSIHMFTCKLLLSKVISGWNPHVESTGLPLASVIERCHWELGGEQDGVVGSEEAGEGSLR